ncbi:hypothetical protein J0A68_22165 [Algoriphagus sp. H41]|uniref:Uncharacterized protein n=1 Tax=Algoriphagus oliviformis TaxID=2811231 RepID=A0ABS3C9F0_9BACT|nr:hypothetical protein [Algoriphagus oliviformis]MBN7813678.1 hypothetical protein [Algoriphagus oliviformis]
MIVALIAYLAYRVYMASRLLIPISVLAIVAGVVFEGRRLSDKWSTFLLKVLGAFVLSFFAFLPFKNERGYNLDNHIEIFPYYFILMFAIASIVVHGDKVVAKLSEGVTLLQSIAVIYWVIDYGFFNVNSVLLKVVMVVGLLFSVYSVFHAFTHTVLTRTSRLTLSIWSSVIMMVFAVDNVFRVFQNEQIERAANMTEGIFVGLQFFLLGVSAIYFIQNFLMLAGFLPGRGTFFNKQYFRELANLKKEHIKRYSDRQVQIHHSLFCLLFVGVIFFLNHYYQFVPRHMAIWLVFFFFPLVLSVFDLLTRVRRPMYR